MAIKLSSAAKVSVKAYPRLAGPSSAPCAVQVHRLLLHVFLRAALAPHGAVGRGGWAGRRACGREGGRAGGSCGCRAPGGGDPCCGLTKYNYAMKTFVDNADIWRKKQRRAPQKVAESPETNETHPLSARGPRSGADANLGTGLTQKMHAASRALRGRSLSIWPLFRRCNALSLHF
jgi:hypothetical protein